MFRRLKLTNFKCFRSVELRFVPLTLLCGLNGMGKSSVIQALLVLRQSVTSGELREGRLVLGGDLTDLGTGQDVLCEEAELDVLEFALHGDDGLTPCRLSFDYSRTANELRAKDPFPAAESGIKHTCCPPSSGSSWISTDPPGSGETLVTPHRLGKRKCRRRAP